jgi:RsiW-degrading membrane proteinase PrsW (M82 family)
VIGVAEEGVKFFLLLPLCMSKKYKKYEEVTADYMVSLAIAFSLGFATVENIIYVVFGEALTAVITGVYRMFFTVPAHIMFGALMGCGFAYAKFHESTGKRALYLSLAFFLPILMHGAFDFLIDLQKQAAAYLMVVLVALLIIRSCKKMKHLV